MSKCEKIICELLTISNINYETEKQFPFLPNKFYDIFLTDKKIVIEFDGIQHFVFPNAYYKTLKDFTVQRLNDLVKTWVLGTYNLKILRLCYKCIKDLNDLLIYRLAHDNNVIACCSNYDWLYGDLPFFEDRLKEFLDKITITIPKIYKSTVITKTCEEIVDDFLKQFYYLPPNFSDIQYKISHNDFVRLWTTFTEKYNLKPTELKWTEKCSKSIRVGKLYDISIDGMKYWNILTGEKYDLYAREIEDKIKLSDPSFKLLSVSEYTKIRYGKNFTHFEEKSDSSPGSSDKTSSTRQIVQAFETKQLKFQQKNNFINCSPSSSSIGGISKAVTDPDVEGMGEISSVSETNSDKFTIQNLLGSFQSPGIQNSNPFNSKCKEINAIRTLPKSFSEPDRARSTYPGSILTLSLSNSLKINHSPSTSPNNSPRISPKVSPSTSPRISPSMSPSMSPRISPSMSPLISPSMSPSVSPSVSPRISPSISPNSSPLVSPRISLSTKSSISPPISLRINQLINLNNDSVVSQPSSKDNSLLNQITSPDEMKLIVDQIKDLNIDKDRETNLVQDSDK